MSIAALDVIFAYAHHLAIGSLVAFLAVETALMRARPTFQAIERLPRIDAGIGISATIVLIAGTLRVVYGVKGPDYYLDYQLFWIKMALFAAAALSSLPPTLRFRRWRAAQRKNSAFVPPPAEVAMVRMHMKLEWFFLLLIPLAAVLMARGFWF